MGISCLCSVSGGFVLYRWRGQVVRWCKWWCKWWWWWWPEAGLAESGAAGGAGGAGGGGGVVYLVPTCVAVIAATPTGNKPNYCGLWWFMWFSIDGACSQMPHCHNLVPCSPFCQYTRSHGTNHFAV